MSRADFYLLPPGGTRQAFACRLVEKVYKLGQSIWLRLDAADLLDMEQALWVFKPESFIPHQIFNSSATLANCPVWLINADQTLPQAPCDLLINLALTPLQPGSNVARIAEIVPQDETIRRITRQQYTVYKALEWQMTTHTL